MIDLTLTQQWAFHTGYKGIDQWSDIAVNCGGNLVATAHFQGPESASVVVPVEEGVFCTLQHMTAFSAFETESSCEETIEVSQPTECVFISAGFDETVPTLSTVGLVVLIAAVAALAYNHFR